MRCEKIPQGLLPFLYVREFLVPELIYPRGGEEKIVPGSRGGNHPNSRRKPSQKNIQKYCSSLLHRKKARPSGEKRKLSPRGEMIPIPGGRKKNTSHRVPNPFMSGRKKFGLYQNVFRIFPFNAFDKFLRIFSEYYGNGFYAPCLTEICISIDYLRTNVFFFTNPQIMYVKYIQWYHFFRLGYT